MAGACNSTSPRLVWINPLPRQEWLWHPSIKLMNDVIGGRMHPLTWRSRRCDRRL